MGRNPSPSDLKAIVDIGSNGIRFSISDFTPLTRRIMPTLFQDRADISLYDAQYKDGKQVPIPEETVEDVIRALKSFQRTCGDFGVPKDQIQLVATEAMRQAPNSIPLRQAISHNLGWEIQMLSKEDESRIGAMGVASSLDHIKGFVMDLGGGSVQIAWVETVDGEVNVRGTTSLPYGAAALTRRMAETKKGDSHAALSQELEEAFASTIKKIKEAAGITTDNTSGISLYLSGGGFRGWGQLLMDKHAISPYPIPIINGFRVPLTDFSEVSKIATHLTTKVADGNDVFRISDRRATQIPAVSLLIASLARPLSSVGNIYFAQGGVREGAIFSQLPSTVRAESPLVVATTEYAKLPENKVKTLQSQLVAAMSKPQTPALIQELLLPFTNMLYVHRHFPKGANAPAALRSTTTGTLGSVHGWKHEQRAALGLMLCARWGGELPPTDEDFQQRLQRLVGDEISWWAKLVGVVGAFIAAVYPAGLATTGTPRLKISCEVGPAGKHGKPTVGFNITFDSSTLGDNGPKFYEKQLAAIEKVGKKKNWIGGNNGYGYKVVVSSANS